MPQKAPKPNESPPAAFNLWTEPWIALEGPAGHSVNLGLEQALLQAHTVRAIQEISPLAVVGIQRLLVAILQAIVNPQANSDLKKLRAQGKFSEKAIRQFGAAYKERFDLFSAAAPFLQSADLSLAPAKSDNAKSVAYLSPDLPAGTAIMLYHHQEEDHHIFCPVCAASCLAAVPAFATSGGAGIKPSINGVPPIYILPGGATLFDGLVSSLVTPPYQPQVASQKRDDAWWARSSKVGKGKEVTQVGYLHSLTFPARRVRLHPEPAETACTRCGRALTLGVRTMVFEMGEFRSKDAPFWFDPFAAYRIPVGKSKTDRPTPIRPNRSQAVWREYANLFLLDPHDRAQNTKLKHQFKRPAVLDQLAALNLQDHPAYNFRCVGLSTDMKAKIFEWLDAGFEVPPTLLGDEDAGWLVREAIRFARDGQDVLAGTFRGHFGGKSQKSERHKALKNHLLEDYWAGLAAPFRQLVLELAEPGQRQAATKTWADTVVRCGQKLFEQAADSVGTDAVSLRQSEIGKKWCWVRLSKKRKEYLHVE